MLIIEVVVSILGAAGSFATYLLFRFRVTEKQQERLERLTDKIKKSRILLSEDYKKKLVKFDRPNFQNVSFCCLGHDESEWATPIFGIELIVLHLTYVENSVDEFYIILNLLKEVPFIDLKLLQEISKYYINFKQANLAYQLKMGKLMNLNILTKTV